jgi:hypothetical protein
MDSTEWTRLVTVLRVKVADHRRNYVPDVHIDGPEREVDVDLGSRSRGYHPIRT